MKKYLFIALAAFGFAACADKLDDTKSPAHNGEVEESYIAINLMAADVDSRAEDNEGAFEYGTAAERAIKTAYFFFFDENGKPFNVMGAPATAPGGSKNHLPLDITPFTSNDAQPVENVSDISNAVLILNTYKGVYPSKIVAVLNWIPEDKTYTLEDLHGIDSELVSKIEGVDYYVMSNSVYMDGANKMVDAVPLTTDNIKKSSEEALAAPVQIYVERVAAKVVLTAGGKVEGTTNIFNTDKEPSLIASLDQLNTTPVYVQLLGWELYNDYNKSYLVKNIDTAWTYASLGLNWNDYFNFRCYWATSLDDDHNDSFYWKYEEENQLANGFKTEYGFAVASAADYTDANTYTYCGENTNGATLRTKVILKGQLVKADAAAQSGYSALELASWYGNEYAGEENLKIAVANSLANTLYHSTDNITYTPINKDDIVCDEDIDGIKSYQTGFRLSDAGKAKTWYLYSSEGGHQRFGELDVEGSNTTATNAYLATKVQPAIIYRNGMTYYMVDVEHFGAAGTTAEYGVVRNHVYQIDINKIKGYGSPVYSGFDFIVENPEYPEKFDDTYVAAKINVLSWKVVKQSVDIVQ